MINNAKCFFDGDGGGGIGDGGAGAGDDGSDEDTCCCIFYLRTSKSNFTWSFFRLFYTATGISLLNYYYYYLYKNKLWIIY